MLLNRKFEANVNEEVLTNGKAAQWQREARTLQSSHETKKKIAKIHKKVAQIRSDVDGIQGEMKTTNRWMIATFSVALATLLATVAAILVAVHFGLASHSLPESPAKPIEPAGSLR